MHTSTVLSALALVLAGHFSSIASADATVDPARLSQHVKTLSSDAFEGRGPATPGEQKTVAYLTEQMKAAGLQPGGDLKDGKRAWTQDVPLAQFNISGPVDASVTAGGQRRPLAQGKDIAIRAAATNIDRVQFNDAPVVFLGYGVTAPERNWDDYKGVDMKGKVGVVLVNDPDFETESGEFGGRAMTYYGRWTYKYEEGARHGALGIIIVHETKPASYGWATVENSNTNTIFDILRANPRDEHVDVEAWIQRDIAVELFKQAGVDFEALKKQAQSKSFRAVPLKGVTMSANYKVAHETVISKNVAGLLPGTTRANETVVYSAHWDHLGIGKPDATGDRIFNGAVDNATGCAALLELARLFSAAPKPERSVLFLAVTAEEKGLLGSEYYASKPLYPLETTVADINMDSLGTRGPTRDFGTIGANTLVDEFVTAAQKQGRTLAPDPRPEAGGFFRSDHFPFSKAGVPAVSFGSGEDLVNGGKEKGRALREEFTAKKYHQPKDEWSEDLDFTGTAKDVALIYDVGRTLATSGKWPEWKAGSEFKGLRDKSSSKRK
ncbi:MAG TPA: M28 family metallopeptidase [Steroidobacteraceae bacterium]|jgi:Zn-dependent M28 family amino/carboxypeptidase|nr:M28 family metallopeptidase [Steroidobacteraceae bacterium]